MQYRSSNNTPLCTTPLAITWYEPPTPKRRTKTGGGILSNWGTNRIPSMLNFNLYFSRVWHSIKSLICQGYGDIALKSGGYIVYDVHISITLARIISTGELNSKNWPFRWNALSKRKGYTTLIYVFTQYWGNILLRHDSHFTSFCIILYDHLLFMDINFSSFKRYFTK